MNAFLEQKIEKTLDEVIYMLARMMEKHWINFNAPFIQITQRC